MVVLSNRQLGAGAELVVSAEIARAILTAIADAARPHVEGRWEHELVAWLDARAREPGDAVDVGDLAWTPDHFEHQRRFLIDAIERATPRCVDAAHGRALAMWRRMIDGHGRQYVIVGRRWRPAGVSISN